MTSFDVWQVVFSNAVNIITSALFSVSNLSSGRQYLPEFRLCKFTGRIHLLLHCTIRPFPSSKNTSVLWPRLTPHTSLLLWLDKETGILVSFLNNDGTQLVDAPVKGSYSALNTSYLTYVNEQFACNQYTKLKHYFWKDGVISGFKEYYDRNCPLGLDIDAGPIIFGLSPSGTTFATGAVTYFSDNDIRTKILRTAEKAGHTIIWNGKRHYALANLAIVGEAIMLAMRTHVYVEK